MQQAILYLTRFMGKTVKPRKHGNLNKNKEVQRKHNRRFDKTTYKEEIPCNPMQSLFLVLNES